MADSILTFSPNNPKENNSDNSKAPDLIDLTQTPSTIDLTQSSPDLFSSSSSSSTTTTIDIDDILFLAPPPPPHTLNSLSTATTFATITMTIATLAVETLDIDGIIGRQIYQDILEDFQNQVQNEAFLDNLTRSTQMAA